VQNRFPLALATVDTQHSPLIDQMHKSMTSISQPH